MTSPPYVTTAQYGTSRTGANLNETCLSAASWPSGGLSIQFSYPTVPSNKTSNSPVYAQPLYVPGLAIGPGGALRNVVFIATLDDYVYAYDADNVTSAPYWTTSLIGSGDCGGSTYGEPIPNAGGGLPYAGVVSTPTIFVPGPTITVVGGCRDTNTSVDSWYLHTLNLLNGVDISGSPVAISASVSSSDGAAGCSGTGCNTLLFNAASQNQRPALLQIEDGVTTQIYIAFGVNAHAELKYQTHPYHGWLIGYNPGASTPSFQFVVTPTGPTGNSNSTTPCTNNTGDAQTNPVNICGLGGGIWMAGKGPVSYYNSGTRYVYVGTSNGGFQTGSTNWGSSVLGFAETATGAPPTTSFTPAAYTTLNNKDQDMGTSGPLMTSQGYITIFDKTGQGYVLSPSTLGGFNPGDTGAIGEFAGSLTSGLTCTPGSNCPCNGTANSFAAGGCDEITSQVFFNNTLLLWPWNEDVDWCAWNGSNKFVCYPSTTLGTGIFPVGFPGGTLSLSIESSTDQSAAILWAIVIESTAAEPYVDPSTAPTTYKGYLFAYKLKTAPTTSTAGTLTELWNSSSDTWLASLFAMPTVVNGRVYVPTYDSGVLAYAP